MLGTRRAFRTRRAFGTGRAFGARRTRRAFPLGGAVLLLLQLRLTLGTFAARSGTPSAAAAPARARLLGLRAIRSFRLRLLLFRSFRTLAAFRARRTFRTA
ncbi:MAG TPA: hypothetical protein VEK57_09705 [Thermoanaerobaculia bacterium]|nr:hypothetical protein [Thermoanaerobaculia bacterium]